LLSPLRHLILIQICVVIFNQVYLKNTI
jgi:hypothetical protein